MKKLFLVGSALILLDQLTKYLFKDSAIYLTDNIALKYSTNTGAAFSLLNDSAMWLALAGAIALVAILYYYKTSPRENSLLTFGLIFLFAGTMGNLIDRIMLGFVRDFILIWKWPIFNLADMLNTIGAGLIIFALIKDELTRHKKV